MREDQDCTVLDGVTVLRKTDAALYVRVPIAIPRVGQAPEVRQREAWIPLAEIHDDSEIAEVGDTGALVIPEWLAADRGLE